MKFLKDVFDFYINASVHVALAVSAFVMVTYIEFNLEVDKYMLCFVFFATVTGYNFVKYFGLAKFHHRSLATWLKVIQLFSLICFLLMCYYLNKLQWRTIMVIMTLAVITFLYAIPFLPNKVLYDEHRNLRQISGVKVYVIALVWAIVGVVLPLVNVDSVISMDVMITVLQRYVLVVVLMLPFEIRDLNYDSLKLSTIPQRIGIVNTKIIGVLLLLSFFFAEYFKDELQLNVIMSNIFLVVLTLGFVLFSKKDQSKYYSAFWVESIPVMWGVVLFLLS